MKISGICPTLYRLSYFKYVNGEHTYSKLSFEKSQYAYHVLMIDKGALDVFFGGKTTRIKAGDALYLLPGEVYRILPCGEDFSLYNLFFDFHDGNTGRENKYQSCVFTEYYDSSLCLERVYFEDAETLNESGVFRNISILKELQALICKDPADALYAFYGRAMLFSFFADMLDSSRGEEKESSAAEQILEYIRVNPEKDLTADTLSRVFSYHKNHINKLVKQRTGKTLCDYIRHSKIEYAKTLLLEGAYSMTNLSVLLGYYDYSHFYKAFYKETGITPTDYVTLSGVY